MFKRIERWFVLSRYRHKLGPLLVQRYGREPSYTPAQVLTTIKVHRLNEKYASYACAMFCSKKVYTEFVDERRFESVGVPGSTAWLASVAWLTHAEIAGQLGSSAIGSDSGGIDPSAGGGFSFDGGGFSGADGGGGSDGGAGGDGGGGDGGQ